jgi:acylphosphatase
MKRIIVTVRGRVQGVGYRYNVADGAGLHDIAGNVRNLQDGSVRVIAEGSEESLLKFVGYLSAEDDPVIFVDHLELTWDIPTGEFTGFVIRH